MPRPTWRTPLAIFDRLLRPEQATRNAGRAAAEATDGVQRRERLEDEVAELTENAPRGRPVGEPD